MSGTIQLPTIIRNSAISLEELGIKEVAWKWEDAQAVIQFLKQNDLAILGGDVYRVEHNQKEPTYDSWYIDRKSGMAWSDYVDECQKITMSYINNYYLKNGANYCYSLVYAKKALIKKIKPS
ncbi:Imm40 family immunity protein [Bacillus badius]|uniref:Imm40 family immunity protein n=1 Tax=Bacillus badius TaxID=1455 RepID=UPI000596B330|nr:Imm40 family immunity protein [Bacillus badius]MED4718518.1 Imm40 family immunity protein [Bacillus badius]